MKSIRSLCRMSKLPKREPTSTDPSQHLHSEARFGDTEVNSESCYRKLVLIKVTLSTPFLLIFPFSLMIETY